jgi:hypothetical protein
MEEFEELATENENEWRLSGIRHSSVL